MSDGDRERTIEHWGRDELLATELQALRVAGLDIDHLDADELAATDQFHGGGLAVTIRLAELAGLAQPSNGHSRRPSIGIAAGGTQGVRGRVRRHLGKCVTPGQRVPAGRENPQRHVSFGRS